MILEVITDAAMDSVRLLPFLFLAFLMLELLEHSSGKFNTKILSHFRKAGPVLGALLGCIPQCGIPVLAANLFSGALISPGTLFSVFLSTSDEALLILLGNEHFSAIIPQLLFVKIIIAIAAGYITDIFFLKHFEQSSAHRAALHSSCDSTHSRSPFLHALQHTVNLFSYIFLFSTVLGIILEIIGFSQLSALLLKDSAFQPFLTAFLGLIPSCASSILLTKLYFEGILSFASFTAGLCSSTGVGTVILLKVLPERKMALRILCALYLFSAAAGIVLYALF